LRRYNAIPPNQPGGRMQLMRLPNNDEHVAGDQPELGARRGDLLVSPYHGQHQGARLAA